DQVKSGWISMGRRVQELEAMISEYTGAKYTVALNSGTATLHAALIALGVERDDEVIVPSLSYISSANAVLYCQATPVFVEEDESTFNITAESIEKKITNKTKVIMTVDLKGMPVDYDAIIDVANRYDLKILADSAESFGAKYKDKLVGTQVDIHSFSMFANKNITSGEGGFITTNSEKYAETCRCVRNQGQSERYKHVMLGHNYRMTDVTAAIAIEQLKRVEWIMEEKNALAKAYNSLFAGHKLLRTPYVPEYVSRHSWYMYSLIVDEKVDRDCMIKIMKEKGVDSRLSFPLIPYQPIYKELYGYKKGDFPKSEKIFKTFLDIPNWVNMPIDVIHKVADIVIESAEKSANIMPLKN
ncbi:MAG: DegT/DnrJ/EryC1/StrS family aminotransferase, partial [Campylobacterota bacterium]